ncbi:unnamed protein product, partial [Iphiclides podalirius]
MNVALVYLLFISAALCSPRLDPLVDTKKGLIRGLQASDGDYAMFLGIPYARVNESNPFGPSHPYPDFEEVFEAYDGSAKCPQIDDNSHQIIGSLDCLRMNVYVPNKASSRNRLPVLVYIHGGVFQVGNGGRDYFGPKYLVRHDVVLVTINYRVGAYGFMCLDTADVPGNQGLKDQLIALRWVRDNIGAFGGDADKVTLGGQSAGSVSVEFHLLSKQEKLFERVILQSGTTLCPWVMEESNGKKLLQVAERLGLDVGDTDAALAFLATVDPELVIAAVSELGLQFLPCVEKEFEGVESVVAEHPVNSAVPNARSVPILVGYTRNEMLFYSKRPAESYQHGLDMFYDNLTMTFDLGEEDRDLEKLVRQFYIGDETLSLELQREITDYESDFTFNYPVHRRVHNYLENAAKVYYYVFSYYGDRNYGKIKRNLTDDGVAHSDDVAYLFDISMLSTEAPTEEDQLVIDRMTTMWTNFVKYGDPIPEATDLLPVKWAPATSDVLHYLDIGSELDLKRRPFHDRMAFWDLFFKMNIHLLKGYRNDIEYKN